MLFSTVLSLKIKVTVTAAFAVLGIKIALICRSVPSLSGGATKSNAVVFVVMGFLAYLCVLLLLVFFHGENISTFDLG